MKGSAAPADAKPKPVVIGSLTTTSPLAESTTDTTVINPQVRRLRLATILFVGSMFFGWRLEFWDVAYHDHPRRSDMTFGLIELIEMIGHFFTNGLGFSQYDDSFVEFVGWQTLFVFTLRDLMFLVLTATFVVCWLKRDGPSEFFEKVGLYFAGYFAVVSIGLIFVRLGLTGLELDFYTEYISGMEGSASDVVIAPGYWLAGLSGVLIHPKLISRSDSVQKPTTPQPDTVSNITPTPELVVMILYYLPLFYLILVADSVASGGDDDALFMGTVFPILGFLIGLFQFRWAFFKAFAWQITVCIPVAVTFFILAGGFGVFGDIDNLEDVWLFVLLPVLYLPVKHHIESDHVRALGAAYAASVGFFIILFGLGMGMIMRYGLF
tara:strand:- start:226 stop:1365 length:1140 start_codon:yes stop_codon:yes gene_type:complete